MIIFGHTEEEHHISIEGIWPSEENVYAIMEFPMPETYTEVRAFVDRWVTTTTSSETLHICYMHCMVYWVMKLRWDW